MITGAGRAAAAAAAALRCRAAQFASVQTGRESAAFAHLPSSNHRRQPLQFGEKRKDVVNSIPKKCPHYDNERVEAHDQNNRIDRYIKVVIIFPFSSNVRTVRVRYYSRCVCT